MSSSLVLVVFILHNSIEIWESFLSLQDKKCHSSEVGEDDGDVDVILLRECKKKCILQLPFFLCVFLQFFSSLIFLPSFLCNSFGNSFQDTRWIYELTIHSLATPTQLWHEMNKYKFPFFRTFLCSRFEIIFPSFFSLHANFIWLIFRVQFSFYFFRIYYSRRVCVLSYRKLERNESQSAVRSAFGIKINFNMI